MGRHKVIRDVQRGTPKFLKAMERFAKAAAVAATPEEGRLAFRDEMLKLGHEERIRNLYRIQDKLSKKAVFFDPKLPQEKYLQNKKGRDIILKIRQVGFTTLAGIRGLDYTLWEPNSRTGIMAHLQTVVQTIFKDNVKFTYSWFKKDWGHLYNPEQDTDSSTSLSFKSDGLGRELNSSMRVLFDFRGKTVHFLHVSEASRIENERLIGSLQGVPANGEVIFESTPNGRAGEFYRQWQNWRSMGALAPYKGHFIPWYEFYPEEPENWTLPEGTELTPYENHLLETLPNDITEAHIAWRRWCIEANCQGDPELFENEYPSNDIDCFFTGENLVFGSMILKNQDKHTRPPAQQGFLFSEGPTKLTLHEDNQGYVFIWAKPEPMIEYVIGADSAGGVGKDASAAYVLNRHTGEICAAIYGQLEPAEFGTELYKLAHYYNKAWINPEANNHGHLTIHVLQTKGYKHIYKRKTFDDVTKTIVKKLGWVTTNESKLVLTEKFKAACKDGKVIIRDPGLISEMSTFVQFPGRIGGSIRRQASSGCHDDRVIAACLAWEMNDARGVVTNFQEPDTSDESYADYDDNDFAVGE